MFFCFQHHGELSLSEGEEGGGGLSGWAHSEGAKSRDVWRGGGEWEESLGCQGVTSLDTTSSSPGNHSANPPRHHPRLPSLSLTARKQDHDTKTLAVNTPSCSQVHSLHVL